MQDIDQSIKGFVPKGVIFFVLFVFVFLVIYKYISSSIDEERQKSILKEQASVSSQAKEPLNECLDNVDAWLKTIIASWRESVLKSNDPDRVAICESENIKRTGSKGNCVTTLDELNSQIQRENDQAEAKKLECYKRYK